MGGALVSLALTSLPIGALAYPLDDLVVRTGASAAHGVAGVVAIALILRAARTGERDLTRPRWLISGLLVMVALLLLTVSVPSLLVEDPTKVAEVRQAVVAALLAAGWVLASVVAACAPENRWDERLVPLTAILALSHLIEVPGHSNAPGWTLAPLLLHVLVGFLAFRCAASDLDEAVNLDRARLDDLGATLIHAQAAVADGELAREVMVHDARSALMGLRAALLTLEKYDEQLDAQTKGPLRAAAIMEVAHLEHVIAHCGDEKRLAFDIADVVLNTVHPRRATGSDITIWGGSTIGVGRPRDLQTVLQNLLVNAEVHAPGAPIAVEVRTEGDSVRIVVSDRGPGLLAVEGRDVFQRGVRGTSGEGSGLGLHTAMRLMRAQGGDIELLRTSGGSGASFAITLPRAVVAEPRVAVGSAR